MSWSICLGDQTVLPFSMKNSVLNCLHIAALYHTCRATFLAGSFSQPFKL